MIEVATGIRIVEAFSKAIDVNARIRPIHNNAGIGAILVVNGQETGSQRRVRFFSNRFLCAKVGFGTSWRRADGADACNSQETTTAKEETPDDNGKRYTDCSVDAILNAGEDRHENTSQEDDHLERRDSPKVQNDLGRCDDVSDRVDDDCGKRGIGNIVKDCREGIERQKHYKGCDDSGEWGSYSSLGFDGSS